MIQELTNWTLTSEESMPAEPTTKLVNPTVNPKNLPILTKLLQYLLLTSLGIKKSHMLRFFHLVGESRHWFKNRGFRNVISITSLSETGCQSPGSGGSKFQARNFVSASVKGIWPRFGQRTCSFSGKSQFKELMMSYYLRSICQVLQCGL